MDLSIIIPAYNVENYIEKCLQSVMRFPEEPLEMECLVVNDGSRDKTAKVVEEIMAKDSRIHLINQENGGVSLARNTGIGAAEGRYIMFLDADDFLTEDAFNKIATALGEYEAEYYAFSYTTLYEDGSTLPQPLPIASDISTDIDEGNRLMHANSVFNTCWGKLFIREKILASAITFRKDLPIGEDFLFVLEYYSRCKSVYMTKEPLLFYLQRSGSAMRSYDFEKRLGYTKLLYDTHLPIVRGLKDETLLEENAVYYIKVLTNLLLEYACIEGGSALEEDYKKAIDTQVVRDIVNNAKGVNIPSRMKSYEYKLLANAIHSGKVGSLKHYFRLKSKFKNKI